LTYANAVATLALFVALGGASYAAIKLPKNSVGTKQIKKNAVTGPKVKDNSLTGADVDENTLRVVPTAKEATHAVQASDAQTVGGMSAAQLTDASKLRCPGGTTLVIGVCFETAVGKAVLIDAQVRCSELGRRLPTQGELIAFEVETFTSLPPSELTDPVYFDGAAFSGMTVSAWREPSGETSISRGTTGAFSPEKPFRCVTMPSG
jgi:hypothetical protein